LCLSTEAIRKRSNWLYHWSFIRNMRKRVRSAHSFHPQNYDLERLRLVRTITDFDEHFTAPCHGFANAADYYEKASSLRLLNRIRLPTLLIHSEDDPFTPFAPLRHAAVAANPFILLAGTRHGGHVAFIGKKRNDEDRFWAENRLIEFCKLATGRIQP